MIRKLSLILVGLAAIFFAEGQQYNTDSLRKLSGVSYPDTQRVSSAYHLFRAYFRKGNQDSAFYFNNLIHSIYKNTGNGKFEGAYLHNLGYIQNATGSYDSSVYYYEQALKFREKAGDEAGMAATYNNLANTLLAKGEKTKALESHEKSLAIKKKLNDKRGIGQTLYNLGNLKSSMSLDKEALENYLEALKIGEETGYHELVMNAYSAIGTIYNQIKEHEKAKLHFEKALELAKKHDDKKMMATATGNLATYYFYVRDTSKARQMLDKTLELNKNINDRYGIAHTLNSIGKLEMDNGNVENAMSIFKRGLEIAKAIGHAETQCLIYVNIGVIQMKQKKFTEALETARIGLELSKEIASTKHELDFHQMNAIGFYNTGNYKKAYEEFVVWGNMKDSIQELNNIRDLSTMEMKADYQKEKALEKAEQEKKDAIAEEEAQKEKWIKFSLIGFALLVLLIAVVVFRSYRQKSRDNEIILSQKTEVELQKQIVEEKSAMLEEKNKEITDSIKYAKRLQDAILPDVTFIKNILPESFILYMPKDIIAGDFYWFEVISSSKDDYDLLLAACDCTGHGVPGALVSVVCSNALNRAVKEFGLKDPGQILDKTRDLVLDTFSQSDKDVKDGMDVSLIRIEKSARSEAGTKHQTPNIELQTSNIKHQTISWAGANNPLWYTTDDGMAEIGSNKQPIGKSDDPKPFTTHKVSIDGGNEFFLFTDGYADQFGGDKGKKFKYKPMQQLLLSVSGLTVNEQHDLLKKTFITWKGKLEQVDDVCIIGIRV